MTMENFFNANIPLNELAAPISGLGDGELAWILTSDGLVRVPTKIEAEKFALLYGGMPEATDVWEMILQDIPPAEEPDVPSRTGVAPQRVKDIIDSLDRDLGFVDEKLYGNVGASKLHGYDEPPDTPLLEVIAMMGIPMPDTPPEMAKELDAIEQGLSVGTSDFEPHGIHGTNGPSNRPRPHRRRHVPPCTNQDTWDML